VIGDPQVKRVTMSGFDRPGDPAGAETLSIMSAAPKFNQWQYDVVAPWLGKRVLEVGSGIGTMSQLIASDSRELVVLTDTDEWYRRRLQEKFADDGKVRIEPLTLPDPGAPERLAAFELDTVVALNVVEHIEDDVATLSTMARLVGPHGRVVILVPAIPSAYGTLDEELGHFRRYSRASLGKAFVSAGLRVEQMFWYNRVGIVGWWFNGRIRRAPRIPLAQLRTFDRLVPLLRWERLLPLPFGQSLVAIGTPHGN